MSDMKFPALNRVLITARLTADPELRYTASGAAVVNMRLASNRPYKTAGGEWEQDTTFLNVVAWNKLAEVCNEALAKGSPVLVEGRLRSRTWEKDGQKRTVLEIHADHVQFLAKRNGDAENEEEGKDEEEAGGGGDKDMPF